MSKTVIIVNRAAGGGRGARLVAPLLDELASAMGPVSTRHTEAPGHATILAREAVEDGAEVVMAVGGDGTTFEVVNGLLQEAGDGGRPALGILPAGTGNSFVRDLGIDSASAAVRALRAGRTRWVDAVRLRHQDGVLHYVNLLSLGFSARAGALTNRRYKGLGTGGYVLAVLQTLWSLRAEQFPHACDGQEVDASASTLVSFCNSRYTGGNMRMAPAADIADGEVDVVQIGKMGRLRFLSSFPRIFAGTHPDMREVRCQRAARVQFHLPRPVPAMIDGEVLTLGLQELEVRAGVLEVVG